MSCSPGVVLQGPRVNSPGVWSHFARSMKSPSWFIHKPQALFYKLINGICLTTSFVATQSSIHPSIDQKKSWTWLDSCDPQIFPIEKDLFSTLGRNDFILRAKRLQTPGESTLGPGETTPGEQDIGRNNLLPFSCNPYSATSSSY